MFYIDIDNKKFVPAPLGSDSLQRPPSGRPFPPPCPPPARSWESLCGHPTCPPPCPPVRPIERPVLTHTETAYLEFTLLHADHTPVDVTDWTFVLAVDNTFCHDDQLIAFAQDFTIIDAQNGVISFNVECSSVKFQKMLKAHIPPAEVKMEIVRYLPGSADGVAILQDIGIRLKPRLYAWQGAPSDASPNYYTKAQVDSLIKGGLPDSDSSTGIVINGHGDPDPSIGDSGDIYINRDQQTLWIKGQTQWSFLGYISETPELYYEIIEDL